MDSIFEGSMPDSPIDHPEILRHLFYPRKAASSLALPGRRVILFEVEPGIDIQGVMHLAGSQNPNILIFHGNGEIVSDYDKIGSLFSQKGINFSVVDYRGYGSSGGEPTFSSMLSDANAIFTQFSHLLIESGMHGSIFVMGRSLGSAPALRIASRYPNEESGVILESGFAHTYSLLIRLGVSPNLLDPSKEMLVSNLEMMKKVRTAVLLIHGELDWIVPPSDGLALFNAASSKDKKLLVISGADHNTLMLYGLNEYMSTIVGFIERLSSNPSPSRI